MNNLDTLLRERGQKIVFLNIRSLYANHSQLECNFMNSDVYMVCLTESWLKPLIKSHIVDINGFNLARLDRPGARRRNCLPNEQ